MTKVSQRDRNPPLLMMCLSLISLALWGFGGVFFVVVVFNQATHPLPGWQRSQNCGRRGNVSVARVPPPSPPRATRFVVAGGTSRAVRPWGSRGDGGEGSETSCHCSARGESCVGPPRWRGGGEQPYTTGDQCKSLGEASSTSVRVAGSRV